MFYILRHAHGMRYTLLQTTHYWTRTRSIIIMFFSLTFRMIQARLYNMLWHCLAINLVRSTYRSCLVRRLQGGSRSNILTPVVWLPFLLLIHFFTCLPSHQRELGDFIEAIALHECYRCLDKLSKSDSIADVY